MDLIIYILFFVGGAVAWHFFHAKAHVALAALEERILSLEGKTPPTPPQETKP